MVPSTIITCLTLPCGEVRRTSFLLLAGVLFTGVFLAQHSPGTAQEPDDSEVNVRIEPPRIRGGMRYGHWAPLRVTVLKTSSASSFSGSLNVTGPTGYQTSRNLALSSGQRRKELIIPVFCSSSLPVFRVKLLDDEKKEVDRYQMRIRSVFGPETLVVGVSTAFSQSDQNTVRKRISTHPEADVTLIAARRDVLVDLGRWPGIFDRLYLKRSDQLEVPVETNPSRSLPPLTGSDRLPQVRLVNKGIYDVFERPEVSAERKRWIQNVLLAGLFVLLAGLLFCFYRPSSSMNWGILLLLPVLFAVVLYGTFPRKPTVIRQSVAARISDAKFGREVRDVRAAIYPHARQGSAGETGPSRNQKSSSDDRPRRTLRYPIESIRRTIPTFYSEDALPERFPELRTNGAQPAFYWSDFPENGYFVVQEFQRLTREKSPSVTVERKEAGFVIRNQSGTPLRNGWVRVGGRYRSFGRLAPGESRTISPFSQGQNHVDSRERFLEEAFSGANQRQRILRRWMNYVFQLYDRRQPVVVGVLDRKPASERTFPAGYGQVRMPEVIFHRFRVDGGD